MAEEDLDDDEDAFLKQQEIELAERIIQESKQELENAAPDQTLQDPITEPDVQEIKLEVSSADVAVEEPPKKRKRGRPRKEEAAKYAKEKSLPKTEEELLPRRSERRVVTKQRERQKQEDEESLLRELEENIRMAEVDLEPSDDEFEFEEETPKRGRKRKSPVKKTEKSQSEEPVVKQPVERRTKKGRPSKQENVTKKVMSIFQMDDLEVFPEKSQTPERESSPAPLNGHSTINFDNKGASTYHGVPSVSGIPHPEVQKQSADTSGLTKFTPLPIPDVDEHGAIKDKDYIIKYLPGVQVNFETEGKLIDERAFFLEGSEGYFEQHNLRFRPSANSLSANAPELEYDELIPMVELGSLIHRKARTELYNLHKTLYHQWCFELSQGYSLNLFGVGSKVSLMLDFVQNYLLEWYQDTIQDDDDLPAVMVINGYNPETKLKKVIHEMAATVVSVEDRQRSDVKMPKHVSETFPFLIKHLKRNMVKSTKNGICKARLILVIHNIDGEAFRDERSQTYLSQLAALPNVWLLASTDNINLSLLWDLNRFKNFNFLWHDSTTYEPYRLEGSFKQALSMGQSKKFVGTKGAKYVLKSLTTNARTLYKVLLEMQLEKLKEHSSTKSGRTGLRGSAKLSVELRAFYDKCVEAYVASNEMNFKTMLGEYVEHKMCSLAKDKGGTEVVFIPFSFDEMEKLLADEFST